MSFSEDIVVKLGLDTGQFKRDLNSTANTVKKVGAMFGVAFGGREIMRFASSLVNMAGDMKDFADGVGISTQYLQGFRGAFETVGVSARKADSILEKFTIKIGEAQEGKSDIFEKLGVSITSFNGDLKKTSELFEEVLEKISRMGSEAQKNALWSQLLGRGGISASRFGSVEEFRNAARMTPKVSDEQFAQAGALEEAMREVKFKTMKGLLWLTGGGGTRLTDDEEEKAAKERLERLAREKLKITEESLNKTTKEREEEKKKADLIQKQIDLGRQKIDQARTARDDAANKLRADEQSLSIAKADRYKFTLGEIAGGTFMGGPGSGGVNYQIAAARRVMFLEQQAKWLEGRGLSGQAGMASDAALKLRGTITGLNDSERFPFKQQARDIAESKEHLADLSKKVGEMITKVINNTAD